MINFPKLPIERLQTASARPIDALNVKLHFAFLEKNFHGMKKALEEGADPDAAFKRSTLLVKASAIGNAAAVSLLISYRAHVNYSVELNSHTALCSAIKGGHIDTMKLLIAARANVNQISGNENKSPLEWAVSQNSARMAEALLLANAQVNSINPASNSTPLIQACRAGQSEIVSLLLSSKADPNLQALTTPLLESVASPDIVRLLLKRRADPHGSIKAGKRVGTQAIHLAAKGGEAEIAKLLLEEGVSPFTLDVKFRTPYDIALKRLNTNRLNSREKAQYRKTAKVLKLPIAKS